MSGSGLLHVSFAEGLARERQAKGDARAFASLIFRDYFSQLYFDYSRHDSLAYDEPPSSKNGI
jgi:hypothetical protein